MPRNTDKNHLARLGLRIRARRQWLKLSQSEVGDELGLSFQQVQKYERGENDLGTSTLIAIARVLKTTPNALLGVEPTELAQPDSDEFAALMAQPAAAAIVHRLRGMDDRQRKHAHALICTIGTSL